MSKLIECKCFNLICLTLRSQSAVQLWRWLPTSGWWLSTTGRLPATGWLWRWISARTPTRWLSTVRPRWRSALPTRTLWTRSLWSAARWVCTAAGIRSTTSIRWLWCLRWCRGSAQELRLWRPEHSTRLHTQGLPHSDGKKEESDNLAEYILISLGSLTIF